MSVVLDASALLAFLRNESGADRVEQYLSQASISSVNWSFADRACLALARESQLSVVTADRLWLNLDLDLKILSIR